MAKLTKKKLPTPPEASIINGGKEKNPYEPFSTQLSTADKKRFALIKACSGKSYTELMHEAIMEMAIKYIDI